MRIAAVLVSLAVVPASAGAATLVNGPWITDARRDQVTIGFELDVPAPARVVVRDREGHETTAPSPAAKIHRVVVGGLAPDARFRFRVVTGGAESPEGTFQTAPSPDAPARFVAFGDTRSDRDAHGRIVRAILGERPDLVVHTGDYVSDGSSDEDWRTFFDVEKRLLRSTVLAPTVGNHETYREGGAAKYRGYLALAGGRAGAQEDAVYRWGDTLFLLVSSCNEGFLPAQRRFFEKKLREVGDRDGLRHRIAVLHAGPFSSGYHGGNQEMIRDGFVDFLEHAGVDLVISGHDHDYERGVADLPYVVTGGGGAPLYPEGQTQSHQERFESVHHYLRFASEGDALHMWARRIDGSLIEECTLEAAAWECRGRAARTPTQGGLGWIELAAALGFLGLVAFLGTRALRKRATASSRYPRHP